MTVAQTQRASAVSAVKKFKGHPRFNAEQIKKELAKTDRLCISLLSGSKDLRNTDLLASYLPLRGYYKTILKLLAK